MQVLNFPYKTSAGKKLLRDCFPMFDKRTSRNLFAVSFAALTVGIMALFFNLYEPWQPIGPELIPDGSFSSPAATNEWSGWNEWTRLVPDGGLGESPGVVLTTSSNKHGILRFTVYDLTNVPAFRVSLRATAHGIVRGKEGYHLPRAVFFYKDTEAKSLFRLHHGILIIPKDRGWRCYKDYFPVPAGAVNAQLQIQNLGVAGIMQIDEVSVVPVRERPDAPWWKLFFGTLWTVAFGLCLFALRLWARRYGFLIVVTFFLIITGIIMPGKPLDDAIEKTVQTVKSLLPEKVTPVPPPLAQSSAPAKPKVESVITLPGTEVEHAHLIGHLTLFSLLAFLSALSWLPVKPSLKRTGAMFAGLVFFAAATETLQFITADRAAALSDLYIDTTGMAGAVILAFVLRSLQSLIRRD
jgi:VanZ family protein